MPKFEEEKQLEELTNAVNKVVETGDKVKSLEDNQRKTDEQLDDIKNEIANLSTKPTIAPESKSDAQIIEETNFGDLFIKFAKSPKYERAEGFEAFAAKTLNLTVEADGAILAVAEYLDRSILKRAQEMSGILQLIGLRNITKNTRRLTNTIFPDTSIGFENFAGKPWTDNQTPKYGQIKSQDFKNQSRHKLTDEAFYSPDINLFDDMMNDVAKAESMWLAMQVLGGSGEQTEDALAARGLFTKRLDIYADGESWKPTYPTAADAKDARNLEVFPTVLTGIDGKLGNNAIEVVSFLRKMIYTLPSQYRGTSRFYMSEDMYQTLESLRYDDGRSIFSSDRDGGLSLLGKSFVVEPMWSSAVKDGTPIAFGDLKQAVFLSNGDFSKTVIDEVTTPGQIIINSSRTFREMIGANDCIVFAVTSKTKPTRPAP